MEFRFEGIKRFPYKDLTLHIFKYCYDSNPNVKYDTPFHPLDGSSASGSASMHTGMTYVHIISIQSRILIRIRLHISERHFCTPIFIIRMY